MEKINVYWNDLTKAKNETEELDVLEKLRVYLRDKDISYQIFKKEDEKLIDLQASPKTNSMYSITIKFELAEKGKEITKENWMPKNPDNAYYLYNE